MSIKLGRVFAVVAAIAMTGVAVYAAELNFYEQADKKGCASIITERGQSDCASVQSAKDRACSVAVECDVDRQERLIAKYKDA